MQVYCLNRGLLLNSSLPRPPPPSPAQLSRSVFRSMPPSSARNPKLLTVGMRVAVVLSCRSLSFRSRPRPRKHFQHLPFRRKGHRARCVLKSGIMPLIWRPQESSNSIPLADCSTICPKTLFRLLRPLRFSAADPESDPVYAALALNPTPEHLNPVLVLYPYRH